MVNLKKYRSCIITILAAHEGREPEIFTGSVMGIGEGLYVRGDDYEGDLYLEREVLEIVSVKDNYYSRLRGLIK